MAVEQDPCEEIRQVRHDLLNVLTALKSGCRLIRYELDEGAHAELREYLDEMQRELDKGTALVDRLRGVQVVPRHDID